jgi:hypothetical protein
MCERDPSPAALEIVAQLADVEHPPDQVALAEALVVRLRENGPATWSPKVESTTLGNRTFARVYLGRGDMSFLYLADDGRWRMAAGLPVWWRRDLERVLGDDLDTTKRGNGFQRAKKIREK